MAVSFKPPAALNLRERAPGSNLKGGWMGPTAIPEDMNRKSDALVRNGTGVSHSLFTIPTTLSRFVGVTLLGKVILKKISIPKTVNKSA